MSGACDVSVVVPVHDGARFLSEALRSVEFQDLAPREVVVVDDGSTDDSARVASGFPAVRCLRQRRAGVAAARNAGVAASSGTLVAFLDQDDVWAPGKLRRQVELVSGDPALGYVLSLQELFLEPGTACPGWLRPDRLDRPVMAWEPSALLARREVFDRVGPFDTRFAVTPDADWFFRAKDLGVPMAVVDEVLVRRRIHGGNLSRATATSAAELRRAALASIRRQRQGHA